MLSEANLESKKLSCSIKYRKLIQIWLCIILFLCLAIVMLGGATRMTGSGLSITEWKPIHGVIPPLTIEEWNEEFSKYQRIAQFQHVNSDMDLAGFKKIFWWEWSHRLLARIIGLIASIPFLISIFYLFSSLKKDPRPSSRIFKDWLSAPLLRIFIAIPLLVGLQGFIGWWMVSSGIGSDLVSVSQYRLAAHLGAASIIIVFVTYLARTFSINTFSCAPVCVSKIAGILVLLLMFQIYFGALVAGMHAGLSYNTWPLMDGKFIPEGLFTLNPLWKNFFENPLCVQFTHRMCAYLIFLMALYHFFQIKRACPETPHARRSALLLLFVTLQATFGIITLLTKVPIAWGLIHQFFALFVLVFATAHWRSTKKRCAILFGDHS